MEKYILGEIFSSGGATLYKNPSDQTVNSAGGPTKVSQISVRPIAPKGVESNTTTSLSDELDISPNITNENSSAQLLIRMPTGKTIKLSKIPFYSQGFEGPIPDDNLAIVEKKVKPPKSDVTSQNNKVLVPEEINNAHNSPDDLKLKERNRAAALRSRLKRKNKTEEMTLQMEEILKQNKSLQSENQILKKEVVRLKEKLKQSQVSSVDDL